MGASGIDENTVQSAAEELAEAIAITLLTSHDPYRNSGKERRQGVNWTEHVGDEHHRTDKPRPVGTFHKSA